MTTAQLIAAVALAVIKPAIVLACVWFGWWLRGKS
jgi:hypothetical protein